MPVAPAVSCALGIGKKHTSNNEHTGITRHSRTQWFYGLFRALPGDRAFCHRRLRTNVLSAPGRADPTSANLTPASGRQDHTTSPYAAAPFVSSPFDCSQIFRPALHHVARLTLPRPPHPHPASVTIAIRPLCPQNLPECANGRFSQNRPLLELSPLRPKGGRACNQSEGQLRWSSSTRTVARASSPNPARKGVDDGTKRSRCRRY
jgi:hypothetical protein